MYAVDQLTQSLKAPDTEPVGIESIDSNAVMKQQLEKMDRLVQIVGDQSGSDMIARQLDKLDELVRAMQNQVNVSTKILQAAR
jgi:hypothetical protein